MNSSPTQNTTNYARAYTALITFPASAALTHFISRTRTAAEVQGNVQLAAVCFAALGLIAVMPWQLAQTIPSSRDESRSKLIKAGAEISLASILLLLSTLLKYGVIHAFPAITSNAATAAINHSLVTLGLFFTADFALLSAVIFAAVGLWTFVKELITAAA